MTQAKKAKRKLPGTNCLCAAEGDQHTLSLSINLSSIPWRQRLLFWTHSYNFVVTKICLQGCWTLMEQHKLQSWVKSCPRHLASYSHRVVSEYVLGARETTVDRAAFFSIRQSGGAPMVFATTYTKTEVVLSTGSNGQNNLFCRKVLQDRFQWLWHWLCRMHAMGRCTNELNFTKQTPWVVIVRKGSYETSQVQLFWID